MRIKWPVRYIVKTEHFDGYTGCNKGAGSVQYTLNCGHTRTVKRSVWMKRKGIFTGCVFCPLDEEDTLIPKTKWSDYE